ncbi:MAG: hypothetical protein ABWW66_01625 [Archaeoglobaceae archaeon]
MIVPFFLGALSIFSPCVLPLIPVVLASSRGSVYGTLLTMLGLATGVFVILSVSSAILSVSRFLAYAVMVFFALVLLSERLEAAISARVSRFTPRNVLRASPLVLGFSLAFVWLPCYAPFVAIAASHAAFEGYPSTFAYIAGMTLSLAVVARFGGNFIRRNFESVKKIAAVLVIFYVVYSVL